MVCKIIFCSEFPDIPDKAGRVTRRRRTQAVAMRFVFQANAIVIGNEIPRNVDLLKVMQKLFTYSRVRRYLDPCQTYCSVFGK